MKFFVEPGFAVAAGLIGVAALSWIAFGQDAPPQLCFNHHPAKRMANVTYGGLPTQPGFERDHVRPLGLGGPDDISNVKYQRCDSTAPNGKCLAGPAKLKNDDEYTAIEGNCLGKLLPNDTAEERKYLSNGKPTLLYAVKWLADRWPTDPAHGYFLADKPPQQKP